MRIAQTELERALGNLDAMNAHIDAMEHTVLSFAAQMESAKHELKLLRLDLQEIQNEVRAAVKRLQELRGNISDREAESGGFAPAG